MCFVLYSASDNQPPEIPWNESAPAFNVKRQADEELLIEGEHIAVKRSGEANEST